MRVANREEWLAPAMPVGDCSLFATIAIRCAWHERRHPLLRETPRPAVLADDRRLDPARRSAGSSSRVKFLRHEDARAGNSLTCACRWSARRPCALVSRNRSPCAARPRRSSRHACRRQARYDARRPAAGSPSGRARGIRGSARDRRRRRNRCRHSRRAPAAGGRTASVRPTGRRQALARSLILSPLPGTG